MKSIKDLAFLTVMIVFIGVAKPGCTIPISQSQLEANSSPSMNESKSQLRQVIVNQKQATNIPDLSDEIAEYVPVAPIAEALGWTYFLDEVTQTVTVEQQDGVVTTFSIGDLNVMRNGYPIRIREFPKIINSEAWLSGQVWLPGSAIPRVFDVDYANWDRSQQAYRVYRFPEPDQLQTDLEKAAIEAVRKYLQEQKIELTRSPSELAKSPQNIAIQSVQQLTVLDTIDDGLVKVAVSFSTDYEPASEEAWLFSQPGNTQYEYSYLVRFREGQTNLDVISEKADRTGMGVPIPLLNESDFARIADDWKKDNVYSLPKILKIAEEIVREIDRPSFSELLARVTTQNSSRLSELGDEMVLNYFSDSVRSSPGWDAILKLENSKDPAFAILYASSRNDWISATILGNWTVDSINMRPILLDIELSWDGEMWKFTRMQNIRQYENIYDLMVQETQLYEKIAEQFVFRVRTDISPFYL